MSEAQPDLGMETGSGEAPADANTGGAAGGEGGGGAVSWRDSLETDLRGNPSLAKFEDVGSLAKSYVEAQGLIGKKGIIPPGEDATPDQVDEFYTALGRPSDLSGYELDSVEIPEVLQDSWNRDSVNAVVEAMHAKGASKEAVHAGVAKMAEIQAQQLESQVEQYQQARGETKASLEKEWGKSFPVQMEAAQKAFRAAAEAVGVSPQDLETILLPDGKMLGDSALLTKVFAHLGQNMGEMDFPGGKERNTRTTHTPEEAMQKIAELETNPGWMSRDHPEHKLIVARHAALMEQAYPDEEGERE